MTERPVHKRKMKLFGSQKGDYYCSGKNAIMGMVVKGKKRGENTPTQLLNGIDLISKGCILLKGEIMTFNDAFLQSLDLEKPESILILLAFLRGDLFTQNWEKEITPYIAEYTDVLPQIEEIINNIGELNYAQLNEILLIFNMDRISRGYFYFCFVPENEWPKDLIITDYYWHRNITLKELRAGIIRFRGIAMLKYGNFRYAHRVLKNLSLKEIFDGLEGLTFLPDKLTQLYKKRPAKAINIKPINKEDTWLLGYISGREIKRDIQLGYAILKIFHPDKYESDEIQNELKRRGIQAEEIGNLADEVEETQLKKWEEKIQALIISLDDINVHRDEVIRRGIANTNIYLNWDYMDVYVATSMRSKWEFESVYELINSVFSDKSIDELKIRHFDPTQSYIDDRLNKGLLESLMLKRARATIYLVQEIDSLGKDSELAATLAQGKPVIAYVPKIGEDDLEGYAEELRRRPIQYFYKRLNMIQAEFLHKEPKTRSKLTKILGDSLSEFENKIEKVLSDYFERHRFSSINIDEEDFKSNIQNNFNDMCRYLAILESEFYERRASTLDRSHPLALQVNLATGVANGVLVVRTFDECRNLLRRLLTNDLNFSIKYISRIEEDKIEEIDLKTLRQASFTVLEEEISVCPFRIVTGDEKITNSFWNFYLNPEFENA